MKFSSFYKDARQKITGMKHQKEYDQLYKVEADKQKQQKFLKYNESKEMIGSINQNKPGFNGFAQCQFSLRRVKQGYSQLQLMMRRIFDFVLFFIKFMNIAEQIALKKNEFNKQMEQRDIIQEMDDHLKNLHESEEDRSFYQMQYDQKDIQKIITLMLKFYSRQEGQTYQTKKCFYFYIWKYFQNFDIFEKNWELEKDHLEKQRRYPYKNMKKQRKFIEEQIFDLERKNFFQYRQKQILIQLFKNTARKERIIKTIAFHRFMRNVAIISYSNTSKYNTNQNTFKQVVTQIQQNNVIYQKENKQKSRSKSPISNNNSKVSLTSKSQNSKNKSVFKILIYLQKVDDQQRNKISVFFYRWIKIIMYIRQLEQIEEINSINVILNQQVFKESVLRTQIQLIKSEIDSKTYLVQELLNQLLK